MPSGFLYVVDENDIPDRELAGILEKEVPPLRFAPIGMTMNSKLLNSVLGGVVRVDVNVFGGKVGGQEID